MFDNNYKKKYYFYYLFFLSIYIIYALVPYMMQLNGYFLKILLNHFPVISHVEERSQINQIFNKINFTYLFLLNTFLFVTLLFISNKFLVKNETIKIKYEDNEKYIILLSQIVVFICLLILIKDLIDFYSYYVKQVSISGLINPFLDREKFYEYFVGKKQTHFIVGSIFSIFCLKNKKYILPILFILILCLIEISSLSRFYMFLIFVCILLISKNKFLPYFLFFLFLIITYRLFLLGSGFNYFILNLLFEPVSLVTNEIFKISNGMIEWNQINIFRDLILKNLSSNFLFFDYSDTYYIFDDRHVVHLKSFAQYGLLDILAYPVQIFFLLIIIYILRKILDKFYNFKDLYLISNVFCIFMIVRGSAIYGLSFFIKLQIIFLVLSIIVYFIKKSNIYKI